jgi:aminopeptidase N
MFLLIVLMSLICADRTASLNLVAQQPAVVDEKPVEKKKLPRANWIRVRTIDVKHVSIDLRFDWKKKQAYGTTTIKLSPLNPAREVALDAALMTINSVTTQSGAQLKFDYANNDLDNNLRITLDRVYQPSEEVTVKIDYRTNWTNQTDPNSLGGSNGKGLRFFGPTSNDQLRPREIWSIGELQSNRYWLPSYDAPNDLRTTDFTATVDKGLTVISNGTLIRKTDNADGTTTFQWKTDTAYANHLTSFVVGEFVDVLRTQNGVELHNFGYANEKTAVEATIVRLPDMVQFFSSRTGSKFPFPRYSQVFVQDLPWGVGANGLATQSENMIDDDRIHADYLYLWDGLEAETLAQQWFGNYLTARDWSHVWLNRSFAHYFDGLYNEYKNGKDEFLISQVVGDQTTYLADWNAGVRHPIVTRNYDNVETFGNDNYSYSRGAAVLHMLRKELGEENWWKSIRHYVKANANKLVTTDDFARAIEEATGQSMDWFFDQWLYKMGHPVFEIERTYDAAKKQLELKIKQVQKVDANDEFPQVEYFAGKLLIEIDDQIKEIRLEPKAENVFTFNSATEPKLINFDFESTWIKEVKFAKSVDELFYQLEASKDVLARRAAMLELVKLAKDDKTPAEQKSRIHDALRKTIRSNAYWRFRSSTLFQLQTLLAPPQSKPVALDEATITTLLETIKNDKSWTRAAAINFLGMTRDPKYVDLYLHALDDESDRVIAAAATALGKTRSPKAFTALVKLIDKPSWKNQSLMNGLLGLKELGDPHGVDVAVKALSDHKLHRWRLPTPPVWDLRVIAVDTIVALGAAERAYPIVVESFRKAMAEDDVDGIFSNVVLLAKLRDPRAKEVFEQLKAKFKDDANAMTAVTQYETQFNNR